MSAGLLTSFIGGVVLMFGQAAAEPAPATEYASAKEAYQVGAAFYNSRNFKASRAPFEAALRLAKDDEYRVKVYQALLSSYREVPEFEPYQTASEFIITHAKQDATRSLARRAFLSFAFNRGQLDNLVKRYEDRLTENKDDLTAVYVLSELYSVTRRDPKRAIELIEQLAKMEAKRDGKEGDGKPTLSPRQAVKVAREKANLARQHARAKEYDKAAELYEEIAPLDPTTHAWNLKEAASARLKDGDQKEALRLANAADAAAPEARNDQLSHFFHRNLGDIFMAVDLPEKAVGHYTIALEKTKIEGYVKGTQASLAEAQAKSGKK